MLLRQDTLRGIQDGTITLAFRRWRRPTVKSGGTLMTSAGQLHIDEVRIIDPSDLSPDEAAAAGYRSVQDLLASLYQGSGQLYRVAFGALRPDFRLALRAKPPSGTETAEILRKLAGMDARSTKPWTRATLELIGRQAGVRAGDLAEALGFDRLPFKANVRKLKALGLTISLEVGYELAPRGRTILEAMRRQP